MKRLFVLTLMAAIIAIMGVRPLYAQDFGFAAQNKQIPGLTNNGVSGASKPQLFLNTTLNAGAGVQPTGTSTFNAQDVAVGDFNADGLQDIIAVSTDAGVGSFTLFVGLNDGTFGLPLNLLTSDVPSGIASA